MKLFLYYCIFGVIGLIITIIVSNNTVTMIFLLLLTILCLTLLTKECNHFFNSCKKRGINGSSRKNLKNISRLRKADMTI